MAAKTVVRGPGEGDAVWMLDSLFATRASSDETDGALTVMEMTVAPGMGPPPHVHDSQETVYAVEGQARYHINGETYEGGPGTIFHVPAGIEENFEPAGSQPLRVLVVYTPGGMDKFFAEAGEPAQRHELPQPSQTPPDLERLGRIAEKHGLQLRVPAQQ
jgi:quercetin dioxygenase-like cupin family protein